jgi:hypothetical protein
MEWPPTALVQGRGKETVEDRMGRRRRRRGKSKEKKMMRRKRNNRI